MKTLLTRKLLSLLFLVLPLLIAGCGQSTTKDIYFSVVKRRDASGVPKAPAWLAHFQKDGSISANVVNGAGELAKDPAKYFADDAFLLSAWWLTERVTIEKNPNCILVCTNGKRIAPILFQESTTLQPWLTKGKRIDVIYRLGTDDIPERLESPKLKAEVTLSQPSSLSDDLIKAEWIVTTETPL